MRAVISSSPIAAFVFTDSPNLATPIVSDDEPMECRAEELNSVITEFLRVLHCGKGSRRTPVTSTPKPPEEEAAPKKKRRRRRTRRGAVEAIPLEVDEVPQAPKKERHRLRRCRTEPAPTPLTFSASEARTPLGRRPAIAIRRRITECPDAPKLNRIRPLPYRLVIRKLEL